MTEPRTLEAETPITIRLDYANGAFYRVQVFAYEVEGFLKHLTEVAVREDASSLIVSTPDGHSLKFQPRMVVAAVAEGITVEQFRAPSWEDDPA